MRDKEKYKRVHNKYADIACCVIDEDITIIDEEVFHRKNGKFFALNFHNVFVKQMLKYVKEFKEANRPIDDMDYKLFNRRLSYIESVFPVYPI